MPVIVILIFFNGAKKRDTKEINRKAILGTHILPSYGNCCKNFFHNKKKSWRALLN